MKSDSRPRPKIKIQQAGAKIKNAALKPKPAEAKPLSAADAKAASDVLDRLTSSHDAHRSTSSLSLDMDNLTGGQIQEVLDFLILNSLKPLIMASDVFNVQLAYLLSATSLNRKRKLSALPREDFMSILSQALLTKDRGHRFELVSGAKIERSFLYGFVVKFMHHAKDYKDIYVQFLREKPGFDKSRLERKLNVLETSLSISRDRMLPTLHIAQDYLDMSYRFRNSIVENYVKMAQKQARAFVKAKGSNFDLNDVTQNFITAITKAIDKYDASQGAITSYVNFWVLNAQSGSKDHDHEYGKAFSIPQLQRKKLAQGSRGATGNFSVSLEALRKSSTSSSGSSPDSDFGLIDTIQGDAGIEQKRLDGEEILQIRKLVKLCDPMGLARLYLDIDETFSESEYRVMVETMTAQGLEVPADVHSRVYRTPITDMLKHGMSAKQVLSNIERHKTVLASVQAKSVKRPSKELDTQTRKQSTVLKVKSPSVVRSTSTSTPTPRSKTKGNKPL